MAVHTGIMCKACRKVHLIATSPGIGFSRTTDGMYQLACKAPCSVTTPFRKDEMRPYRVSEDVFKRGYAETGEYELVEGTYGREVA